jgi:hypothetical protein
MVNWLFLQKYIFYLKNEIPEKYLEKNLLLKILSKFLHENEKKCTNRQIFLYLCPSIEPL